MGNPGKPMGAKATHELSDPSKKLLYYLRRTAAEEVNVKVSQVAELVGEQKANDLCIMCNKFAQASHKKPRKGSLIKASRRSSLDHLGMYNRLDLIAEAEKVHGTGLGEPTQITNDKPTPWGNPHPDPEKIKKAEGK